MSDARKLARGDGDAENARAEKFTPISGFEGYYATEGVVKGLCWSHATGVPKVLGRREAARNRRQALRGINCDSQTYCPGGG